MRVTSQRNKNRNIYAKKCKSFKTQNNIKFSMTISTVYKKYEVINIGIDKVEIKFLDMKMYLQPLHVFRRILKIFICFNKRMSFD